ncbi:uncharacterized protein LOC107646941 [Arachis ipaensis]|uniref:uncharacterized protein LOC107646941 n=1 Tax=Arachis ipaensis TaxID=130454 RepID=UPI0007AFCF10|nr:uncharacterized protein LOC107646941 [Arachis ipaensis]XP_025661549.1 uncharacterized protein LOC112757158 [Arachis hypogaea]
MKPDIMLSLLIPGPQSPGNDIDVFLQPLINELKELWELGVETYDSSKNKTFNKRACLLWTINNFPAYAMLSGWSTKGKLACPCCNDETSSIYLKHSHKTIYMDHQTFLPMNHSWRHNKRSFNVKTELRSPPQLLEGTTVFDILQEIDNSFEKKQKRSKNGVSNWKKWSIFFELPYWKNNMFRHNCIVMHIEKNIANSIIRTLLDIPRKTKGHTDARLDLKDMEKKISGYKTHDAHFMLHYLLQVPIKSILPNHVAIALFDYAHFSAGYVRREHESQVNDNNPCRTKWEKAKDHSQQFSEWFKVRAMKKDVPGWAKGLARGPNKVAKRFSGFVINGYRFHTRHRDVRRKTQNSGVTLEALTPSFANVKDKNPIEAKVTYYGRIVNMFELDYYGQFKVVLFKCEWYTVAKDHFGLSYVYFSKKCYQEEPFVLASQVNQCFYVQDPYVSDKYYVMKRIPRDLFRISDDLESDSSTIYAREPCEPEMIPSLPNDNGEVDLVRNNLRATILDMAPNMFAKQHCEEDEESEYDKFMEDVDSDSS